MTKKRKKAKKKASNSKLFCHEEEVQKLDLEFEKLVNTCHKDYEETIVNRIKDNPREFYRYTKNFTRPNSNIDCLELDG